MKRKISIIITIMSICMLATLTVFAYSYDYGNGNTMDYTLENGTSTTTAKTTTPANVKPRAAVFVYDKNGTGLRSALTDGGWSTAKICYLAIASTSNSKAKTQKRE